MMWIGITVGLLGFFLILFTLWMLHKQVTISIQLTYSDDEKNFLLTFKWLFIYLEKEVQLPAEKDWFELLSDFLDEKNSSTKTKKPFPLRRFYPYGKSIGSALTIKQFQWHTEIGLKHAHETAIAYGISYSLKFMLFRQLTNLMKESVEPQIVVHKNDYQPSFKTNLDCIFQAPMGHIIGDIKRIKKINDEVKQNE